MPPMNVVVCVKQIPDPAEPGQARTRDNTLKRERQAHPRRVRQLRRRDGPPAGRQGRRRRGHPRVDGPQQRDRRPAHRPRHGRRQGHPRQRRRPRRAPAPSTPPRCWPPPSSGPSPTWCSPPPSRPTATPAPCPSRSPRSSACRRSPSPSTIEIDGGTVKVQRQTEAGYDEVECPLPAVVSVTAGVVEPRYPSFKGIMAAKSKPVDELTVADLGLDAGQVGCGRRRPGDRRRRATPRPARPARSSRTTARASPKIVAFLDEPQGHLSPAPEEKRTDMALNTIWVYAEAADGKVSPHHPRDAHQGPRARRHRRGRLRRRRRRRRRRRARRPRRHQGLRHRRPRRLAARRAGRLGHRQGDRAAATAPTCILFGTTYDGRDIAARLSVALDKPVLTNNVDLEVDGDAVVVTEPIFGGTKLVKTKFTAGGPHIALIRPKSFAAEESGGGAAEVAALEVPDAPARAKVIDRHVEEATGPKLDEAAIVVSGGRGLGEAEQVRDDRGRWPSCSRRRRARPGPSSTPAGCPTATRSARPARS